MLLKNGVYTLVVPIKPVVEVLVDPHILISGSFALAPYLYSIEGEDILRSLDGSLGRSLLFFLVAEVSVNSRERVVHDDAWCSTKVVHL